MRYIKKPAPNDTSIFDVKKSMTVAIGVNSLDTDLILTALNNSESCFETGAPTAESNEFVLVAMNSYDIYQLLVGGYSAGEVYKYSAELQSLDINGLDFPWISSYLDESLADARAELSAEEIASWAGAQS